MNNSLSLLHKTDLMRYVLLLYIAALAGIGLPAKADPLDDWKKAEAQAEEAWHKLPMSTRNATFISEAPKGYGVYKVRETNVFKPKDQLRIYFEPIGYDWKPLADGLVSMGVNSDFTVRNEKGAIVGHQPDFARPVIQNRHRAREFYIDFTLTISALPVGSYTVTYTMRDIASDKSTSFDLPFEIEN
ncbi:hypothetical protein GAO09_27435 [Rhizobiales bacterium RZME27]|uniref:Uncharacterized protein n=1 Tax=Endobacterium cereale TaxID=2663029 RepID=A0A6A8AEL6_9HYPH|nr:hypothetical protein [Endobacterium cereale]MEB2842979.1 hypothetical protein [Endobacterium cereale]MQY49765.1 hypothetical protein [Endobacterium cereale]